MAISPTALFSAFADDLEENGKVDSAVLSRCLAALSSEDGLPRSDSARAFIERECAIDSSDVTVIDAAIRFQLKGMFWKYLSTTETDPKLDAVALDKFLSVNKRLGLWQYSPNTSGDEELMGSFKELIWNFWNPQGFPLVTNDYDLLDHGRTGPGVSVGSHGEDFYTKMFSSPLAYTSKVLLHEYMEWASEEPSWLSAESTRANTYGDPLQVHGSSLKFVPKDVRESRTIAIEPSLNMFYQLGLGEILEERIRTFFGVDIRTQQLWNREAARVGSVVSLLGNNRSSGGEPHKWFASLATIDLKSASDSLGLRLLEWAFRPISTEFSVDFGHRSPLSRMDLALS
uniref:RNA-directed RNA polymerase n=1 Tax=Leviviridae sp. TaxID=2027243 RepID=A0A514D1I1_9VIRU|nr:MAG: RNA-dependent RNA polymerase [Leviviridae sp.]